MGGVFLNNNFSYAIFPLKLVYDEKYSALSSGEKILYVLLLNRTNYSRKNIKKFYDDKNGLFVFFTVKQIKEYLNCSEKTVIKMLKNLEQVGLIKKEYQKKGLPVKIYVLDLKEEIKTPTSDSFSFNVERATQKSRDNRIDFGTKKNKPRHNR